MSEPETFRGMVAPRLSPWLATRLGDAMLPVFIVALAAVAGIIQPRFLSASNLDSLGRQIVPLSILSVGQAVAIISGGLDLSLSSVLSLSGIAGVLLMAPLGTGGGGIAMLVVGTACGFASGAVIAYLGTNPLIVTLAMLSVTQAIALILANGVPIYDVPSGFTDAIGFATVAGVPVTVLIALVVLAVGWVLLRRTVFGRYVYAMGSNRAAALRSGIDVKLTTMMVYGFSGLCAGAGGIVLTAWTASAQPVAVPTLTLQSLAAVVLGGVALTGGSGGLLQVVWGVLILGMLSNILNLIGVSSYYQTLATGLVILVAVMLDQLRRRSETRGA